MSYDSGLVERVRDALHRLGERGARERHVFGGWGFLTGKSTFAIVWGDGVIVKVAPDEYEGALLKPGTTPFAPGGDRPMGTWVVVSDEAVADDPELAEWVACALRGVRALPAGQLKTKKPKAKTAKTAKTAKKRVTAKKRPKAPGR